MGIKSLSTFLKKEEVQLPVIFGESEYPEIRGRNYYVHPKEETHDDIMDEFDGFNFKMDVDVVDDDDDAENIPESQLNYWECLMPWDGFCNSTIEDGKAYDPNNNNFLESSSWMYFEEESIKKEEPEYAFLEDDEKKKSLNLSLNYQEVLDAWSDRTLWAADDSSFLTPNNAHMEDEVQVIEEERKEREARVLRYKEKRQTRLFSKKIRYQVRKLNADKRPRLKGRFVKRVAEKMHK